MDVHIRRIMGLPYKDLYSYWQHYWYYSIDRLTDKDNVSFRITGPRMLIKDLVEELDGHGLSNSNNVAYFKKELGKLDKIDAVFNSLCHPTTACLLQRLGDKANIESSILLCKKILNELIVKSYFSLLVDWLAESIDKTTDSNYDSRKRINEITHLVIAEFIAEGFVFDEIKEYATDIPGVLKIEDGDVVEAPPSFYELKQSDYSTDEGYHKAVSERIKSRSTYECLDDLKSYFYATPKDAFFIVRLNGLKGLIDANIGDINIYSPKVKRYIDDGYSLSNVESVTKERDRVNAAIPIEYVSLKQAKVNAYAKLEEVLDILTLTYQTNTPVTIAPNIYAVVEDRKEIASSISNKGEDPLMASNDDMIQYMESLDLTDLKTEGFKFMSDKHKKLEIGHGALRRRLKNASRWYTKAAAAEKDVDVLLYSWFAMEGLLRVDLRTQAEMAENAKDASPFIVIQEFVKSIICKAYFRGYLRGIYRRFYYMTNRQNNYYDITEDVINKAGLNLQTGDRYRDADFLSAVPSMIDCINDDIVRDELVKLDSFYQNAEGIKEKANQISEDILMIYRLRNMIVHNAALSCVNIAFYAREAKFFAQRVIRYVIDMVGGDKTIEEIIIGAKLNFQVFMTNFDNELNAIKQGN